jgi:hypothetical protein
MNPVPECLALFTLHKECKDLCVYRDFAASTQGKIVSIETTCSNHEMPIHRVKNWCAPEPQNRDLVPEIVVAPLLPHAEFKSISVRKKPRVLVPLTA